MWLALPIGYRVLAQCIISILLLIHRFQELFQFFVIFYTFVFRFLRPFLVAFHTWFNSLARYFLPSLLDRIARLEQFLAEGAHTVVLGQPHFRVLPLRRASFIARS